MTTAYESVIRGHFRWGWSVRIDDEYDPGWTECYDTREEAQQRLAEHRIDYPDDYSEVAPVIYAASDPGACEENRAIRITEDELAGLGPCPPEPSVQHIVVHVIDEDADTESEAG